MDVGGLGGPTFVEFNGYLPIALDNNNDLIFTGTFRNQMDFDPSANSLLLNSNSVDSNIAGVFIAKYDNPVNCILSTPTFGKNEFKMYPNPSSGIVTIIAEDFSGVYALSVFDLSGKILMTTKIETAQSTLDLSNLTKGMYLVEINSNNTTTHQKLLIK